MTVVTNGSRGAASSGIVSAMAATGTAKGIITAHLYGASNTNQTQPATGTLYLNEVIVPETCTITGLQFYVVTAGNYTANNNQKIGLYKYNGTSIDLVASCANDNTLWSVGGLVTKAFSTPYLVSSPGTYFACGLASWSALTTAPTTNSTTIGIGSGIPVLVRKNTLFPWLCAVTSQTDLPSNILGSSTTQVQSCPQLIPY